MVVLSDFWLSNTQEHIAYSGENTRTHARTCTHAHPHTHTNGASIKNML